jgi:hypothetical protein
MDNPELFQRLIDELNGETHGDEENLEDLLDKVVTIRVDPVEEVSINARVVSHKTGQYLNGIVGIDGWANFAIALKTYAGCRQSATSGSSEDTYLDSAYLMLMGYALENLAKCIIARKAYNPGILDVTPFEEKLKDFEFTRKDGKKRKLKTHKLHDLYLAEDISFEVSDTEIAHLKVISIYTLWKGRYPVPLEINNVPTSSEPGFEALSQTAINIYDKAMAEVENLRSLRS